MCELTIELKAPYNITLLIDGKRCPAKEIGLYKILLDPEEQHKLEIRVERLDFKPKRFIDDAISLLKLKGRHTDSFDNLFYEADFTLSKKCSTAKIVFEYKKFTTLNFHKKETPVAYIEISRKSKIDIQREEKSVFRNKRDFLMYFFRHRWIEIVIATIILSIILINIFRTFYENQNDLYKPYEIIMSFATNPFEGIIEGIIFVLLWAAYWSVGNIRFIRRSLKISKWNKDEDDKSSFFYKTKFFI